MKTRVEQDALGRVDVPRGALWGAQTQRALASFDVGGRRLADAPELVRAYAQVKAAAAHANVALGAIPADVGAAIAAAADEVARGDHRDAFPLPVLQGGGGTSTNMNLNEVLANLAEERLGGARGTYGIVRPLEHVNCSQSTNDTYPTALAIATVRCGHECLQGLGRLRDAIDDAATAAGELERLGRTCLQDAVPLPVAAGLGAASTGLARTTAGLDAALAALLAVPLGATAVGTGIGAPDGFAQAAVTRLSEISGLAVEPSRDPFDALQHLDVYVSVAGELTRAWLVAAKLAGDLRLLASGPIGGLGEARLPAVQPGSSIMPGKVNPVIPELVLQVGYELAGSRAIVDAAAGGGELELNVMEPAIAAALLPALEKAGQTASLFATRCVDGLAWDAARLDAHLAGSLAERVEGRARGG